MRGFAVRSWLRVCVVVFALTYLPGVADAQDPCEPPDPALAFQMQFEEQDGALRESNILTAPGVVETPQIGFIDSPSATCYQPDSRKNECWINWYYLSVSASPNYMICMYLKINAIGKVARTQGFFQTSMYVPYNMFDKGFRVTCGALGSGGTPDLGAAYAYTVRAYASDGLRSANYGTVYCPAYIP
jgi:hypothetical protein